MLRNRKDSTFLIQVGTMTMVAYFLDTSKDSTSEIFCMFPNHM